MLGLVARVRAGARGLATLGRVGESVVVVQAGSRVAELPLLVRRVRGEEELLARLGLAAPVAEVLPGLPAGPGEEREVMEGFGRCSSSSAVYRLLETIPREEVTPPVAAHALRMIIELEEGPAPPEGGVRDTIRGVARRADTFLRAALVASLVDTVVGGEPPELLAGLAATLGRGWPGEAGAARARLVAALLEAVGEGRLSLHQLCLAAGLLARLPGGRGAAQATCDKLWMGLLDKGGQARAGAELVELVETLPLLGRSRAVVLGLVADRVGEHWRQLEADHVSRMLEVLAGLPYDRPPPALLRTLSGWLALHTHTLTEQHLLAILRSLLALEHVDRVLVRALERLVVGRGPWVREPELMATIASFCSLLRVRSPTILGGLAAYLVDHHATMAPTQVVAITEALGRLGLPAPSPEVCRVVEHRLLHSWAEVPPLHMATSLLALLHLGHSPAGLAARLFAPAFLERVEEAEEERVAAALALIDSALALTCPAWRPRLLRGSASTPVPQDMRVVRLCEDLAGPLVGVVGEGARVERMVALPSLPPHPLLTVHLLVTPPGGREQVAVVVLPPEEYSRGEEHLLGGQALRVRLLSLLGLRVVVVPLATASRLQGHPADLRAFLQALYQEAQGPADRKSVV